MDITAEALAKKKNITLEEATIKLKERAAKKAELRAKKAKLPKRDYSDVEVPDMQEMYDAHYKEIQEEDASRYKAPEKFPDIKCDGLTIKFVKAAKEVKAVFKTTAGQIASLVSKEISTTMYEVKLVHNTVDDEGKPTTKTPFNFNINKSLTAIGDTERDRYRKFLRINMEKCSIDPKFEGDNFKERFDNFVLQLQMANAAVLEVTNKPSWYMSEEKEEEPVPLKTWAEATGMHETFDDSIINQAKDILYNQNFLQYMVNTIENVVIAQRDKVTLASLIALSSCVDDVLHSLGMGSPGSGKSSVGQHVYNVFPKQRRFEFTAESTVTGLINATKFADGSGVFKNKLLYLGDLGNEDQQKNPKVQEIIGMLRILMEKKEYTKIVTDMNSEDGTPIVLTLDGCGSVMVECISKKMEGQFEDRCVRWSPNTGSNIIAQIDAFHNDELKKAAAEARFKKNRPVVACGIDLLFQKVERLSIVKNGFKIFNPYNDFLFELFNMDGTTGNRGRKNLRTLPKLVALSNLFQRDHYWNEEEKIWAIVVTPKDIYYTLAELGKAIGYMLSPIPENILGYIEKIEENFISENCIYTHDEYKNGFDGLFYGNLEKDGFYEHLKECKPITAQEMAKLMNVQPDTARGYLNDLASKEILYLRAENGKAHRYYPVVDFDVVKKEIGATYPSLEDIKNRKDEIEEIYGQFIEEMVKDGYVKRDHQ